MGQKEPPRPGSTICYGQECARKSHQDPAVRFVTAKSGPERATKTRQYDLLRPRVGQKEPPRSGSTICYGQEWARKSHQDPAVRFVMAKSGPKRATKIWQYDLLQPRVGQKEPPRSRQYDLLRRVGQKEPPRPGRTICYGQEWPERATKTRQYDLLRPRVGQKEPPRRGSTICYGQESARKSHQDPAVRFVTAKSGPERATKTRQYDLLRPRLGQKEPSRPGSTICYGQEWARKSHQDPNSTICYGKSGPERATKTQQHDLLRPRVGRKSHQDQAVRFVTAKSVPEIATKTRQYDLLRLRVDQKEPPRRGSTICYGQEWARKSHQDPAVRFVTAKSGPERATKTRQYNLLWPRVGQKDPPRPGSTICYGQEWARKTHQDPAVRFVMAKSGPERATKTRQYDCYGQECARKSHQDRQYDLLRLRVDQKEPPRRGSTICYG